jgi:hypothetical protein
MAELFKVHSPFLDILNIYLHFLPTFDMSNSIKKTCLNINAQPWELYTWRLSVIFFLQFSRNFKFTICILTNI